MSNNISITEKVKALDTVVSAKKTKFPPIGKAPSMLRDSKVKYFEPRAMALGPIHHSNPKFRRAEEFKRILATKFISESGSPSLTLFGAVKDNIGPLRNRYEAEETKFYPDDELALILLIDGCAVLQLIQSVMDGTLLTMVKSDVLAFAVHDLYLLENQLPFKLLQLPMDQHQGGKEMFLTSIRGFIRLGTVSKSKEEWKLPLEPNHLLDLLRESMLHLPQKTEEPKNNDQGRLSFRFPKRSGRDPSHATGSSSLTNDGLNDHTSIPVPVDVTDQQSKGHRRTRETHNQGARHPKGSDAEEGKLWYGTLSTSKTFPNVMEMKAAGIHVKPSETTCLRDFDYEEGKLWYGTLRMPSLWVDDSTIPIFLNVIAYEKHPHFKNKGEVSAYICLMHLLIDDVDDVKELRKAKILHNMLGSDKDVADVFHTISMDLAPILMTYEDFLKKIQKHYDSEWKTTVAQGIHYRFNTPWATIAFVAAVLGLILAFIQALSGFIN